MRQCADVQQLLDVLDLDGVEDLEDLLMLLFRRPVDLTFPQDGSPGCIEVIVHGDHGALGTELEFPLTMSELASSALTEETAEYIGPWSQGQDPAPGGSQLWAMTPEEQAKALMNALGQLRILAPRGSDLRTFRTVAPWQASMSAPRQSPAWFRILSLP